VPRQHQRLQQFAVEMVAAMVAAKVEQLLDSQPHVLEAI